jgi:hypothetical protein
MPCPANELGAIEPFVAIENSTANTGSASSGGWLAIASGAFGHGMPCPYCGKCDTENACATCRADEPLPVSGTSRRGWALLSRRM